MNLEHEAPSRETAELRHSLRTPINHIVGYAELLLEDPQLPPGSAPVLDHILAAARQCLAVVQKHAQPSEPNKAAFSLEQLRSDLNEPVSTVLTLTNELEKWETDQRLSDIRRIRLAAHDLLQCAAGMPSPSRPAAPVEADAEIGETAQKIFASILVVDDADLSKELLCRLLERQGHRCVAVSSGIEALERLGNDRFDLVLLDLMMPDMSGYDTLRSIKCNPDWEDLAVVMLSAFDEVDEIGQCLRMGAEDYLTKPFDRFVLKARLNAILERKRLQNLERRRTLELEIADAELRRSNEDLRRFASVVSHDLQEPLRMVTSYMQLLKRSLGDALTETQREYLEFAIDGGKRMSALIQDLLAYSRVSAGDPRSEIVDLNAVVSDVKANIAAAIQESGAVLISSGLPTVRADGLQIRQLFQNLLSNAIKYRSERPPVIKISVERDGSFWLFAVADNGMGIGAEHRQQIFEMFSRLHEQTVPGTGIGLAICQRVVERLGGRIWVESELGKGSTFYFTIPAHADLIR